MNFSKQILQNALALSVAESFESMAFSEYDSYTAVNKIPLSRNIYFSTEIDLYKPIRGCLQLLCDEAFAGQTMQSIIGDDVKEITEEQVADSLNEVMNTICGCFMRKLTPGSVNFDFGLPRFGRMDKNSAEESPLSDGMIIAFSFSDDILYCVLKNENI